MQTSIFIAKLVGPTAIVLGLAFLLNPAWFRQLVDEVVESKASLLILGMLTLVTGLAVVNVHNDWSFGWPLIITIFGWAAVLGGIARVAAPEQVTDIARGIMKDNNTAMTLGAVINLAIGAVLTYFGYFA